MYRRANKDEISALGNTLTYPLAIFQLLRNGQSLQNKEIDFAVECLKEAQEILLGFKEDEELFELGTVISVLTQKI